MILTCPNCATRYQTDAAMFAPPGRNVRCAKCGQVWFQAPPEVEAEPEPERSPIFDSPAEQSPGPMASSLDMAADHDGGPRMPLRNEAGARTGSRSGRIGGWLVLFLIVGAIVFALLHYRQTVATIWPKSASLYAALGMKVNVLGLDLRDIQHDQTVDSGLPQLEVKGTIVNITNHRIAVPLVRVALIDAQLREVYHWTFDSGLGALEPGAGGAFTTRLTSPPQEARDIAVRFAEAGEQ